MLDFAAVDTVKTMYQMHFGEYLKQLVLELDGIEMSPHIDSFLKKKIVLTWKRESE